MFLTLERKEHLSGNVWSFSFHASQPLKWKAGQFIRVEVPHANPDDEGTKRWFTISSPTHELLVRITTRITGTTFKQALNQLNIGDAIRLLDLPAGDFLWPISSSKSLIFVAHGIGITPFYSMLADRIHTGLPLPVALFYSNRSDPVPPFQSDLRYWASSHPEFTLHQAHEPFTAAKVAALTPDLASSMVYVSGPTSFVELLSPSYGLAGAQLKIDYFPGYTSTNY